MKFLLWLCSVVLCVEGLELSMFTRDSFRWFWIAMLILYFLTGATLSLIGLVQLAMGKGGVGGLSRLARPPAAPPAPHKGE